ncbi:MAG TPA: glycine cleavage system protein GcvH [Caldisericia bacterium]|nr:glycine cleavage system protein GcvH [Caldisericia bacterium]
MSKIKEGYKYTESDEWVKIDGNEIIIGITDYAQMHMGDIVFVEMKDAGTPIKKGEVLTVVESVKSASDIYSPITGELIETNPALEQDAAIVNQDPYDKGWIAKVKASNMQELDQLMDHLAYEQYRKE